MILGKNSLVAAGSVVTKTVGEFRVVLGSPAKDYCNIQELRGLSGEELYPWRDYLTTKRGFPWEE